jgi:hypothetical protein
MKSVQLVLERIFVRVACQNGQLVADEPQNRVCPQIFQKWILFPPRLPQAAGGRIAAPISLNEKRSQEGGFVLVEENVDRQPRAAE